MTTPAVTLDTPTDRVLVRVHTRTVGGGMATEALDVPYVVADADMGWDSPMTRWTWEQLARLDGWDIGRAHHDEHGTGFWLHHTPDTAA